MAIIGTIRKRSGLVVFLIGAAIVGFLVMDATNSQFSVLKGRKDSVAKVDGEKITYAEYNQKYEDNVKNMEAQMRGMAIGDDQRNYLRNQTWNEMVNDIIFKRVYDKLGIGVTPEEMNDLATSPEYASPQMKQQFSNPQTHQFDPSEVRLFLSRLDQDPEGVEPGTIRRQWLAFEAQMKKMQFQQKYNNLISKGLFVPDWLAQQTYDDQNRSIDLKFVQLPYSEVNDADVKVTDADLQKYIDDHAAKYRQEDETRKLVYVTFDINPSAADSMKTYQDMLQKKQEFAEQKTTSDDSTYVKIYSETPFDDAYYDKDKISSPVKDSLFTEPVRSVIGPYLDGGSYKLAKICDRKMISDSVHVREIVLSFANYTGSQDAFNARFKQVDSIYQQLDSLHGDFAAFAMAFSDDGASKMKGGDIGWVKQGAKDKAYNDLIFFHAQKGKIYKVPVQSENAIHLVQVVDERPSKMGVEVAYLSEEIVPSSETMKNIYSEATNFASDNQAEAKFMEASRKLNAKTVEALKQEDFSVMGLGSARDLVKWAFKAKKGEVSPVFTVEKKLVVAMLDAIRPKGLQQLDAVRDQVKPEVVKEKKFEILAKKITDAHANSIDELAGKLGKTAMEANNVTFANPNMNGMFEPDVVAVALGTPVGKMSGPVKGTSGAFVVQTVSVREPSVTTNYSAIAQQLEQQLQSKSRYASEVQKKLAKIDDTRSDFF